MTPSVCESKKDHTISTTMKTRRQNYFFSSALSLPISLSLSTIQKTRKGQSRIVYGQRWLKLTWIKLVFHESNVPEISRFIYRNAALSSSCNLRMGCGRGEGCRIVVLRGENASYLQRKSLIFVFDLIFNEKKIARSGATIKKSVYHQSHFSVQNRIS